ncbi:alpha-L-rhamnosidase [Flavihumibacter solisilvae]|uniref:alpha-L-rhamnosidase n=1 Tax=Flavihumibacter solisilvae TaxID=1349421 RepID=A0A0C1LIH3_9BACT|nr:alpha-L-rhamnosidase [Flavihumibacter solisilvae]KIC95183.1 alpha-L-rhamnosidase [Flavihumibacter solisilvae]
MRKVFLLPLVLLMSTTVGFAQSAVTAVWVENRENPLGVVSAQPRFSWRLQSDKRNTVQTAYEINLKEGSATAWSTGKVNSNQSVHVVYNGKPLESGKKYTWQVRAWDNSGKPSAWSKPAFFTMGLLNEADWKASWITPGFTEDENRPSPLFRKEFETKRKLRSAIAYVTSHGMYEAFINGKRIGDAYLTPGWTSYHNRLQYQVYDLTNQLASGRNTIGVQLGSGWYRGNIGFSGQYNVYGKDIALLFQLEIEYSDGTKELVISDGSWKTSTGEIQYAEIYHGETIDHRKEKAGWLNPGYNDSEWSSAQVAGFPKNTLISTINEPVRKQETFKPVKIFTTPAGEKVIDFGQNLVGWVVMRFNGKAGDSIFITHAEVLDKQGNFYIDNLRSAKCRNIFVLRGGQQEVFEPHFTWQGFRYARIEGIKGELLPENFEAVALYSDMEPTGTFTSSNPLINQLQHNIQWGQRGNFLDVPTDCPQRDERLGWTGDAQAFSRTASFNMNVNSFFAKWLRDVEADQVEGKVPFVVPNVLGKNEVNSAGWADVATIAPWNMYLAYGDKRLLETQYNSMKEFVESMRKIAKNDLWNTGFHFGDWLFYRPGDDNDGRAAVTDKYLIAQCFYAHSTELLVNAAKVLGKTEDAASYSDLLKRIRTAFVNEYLTPSGRLVSSTQTAYVLALQFDMFPEQLREQAAKRLADNIESYDYHLTTGFLGTPYLCHVLTRYGYSDIAYRLLLQDSYPSWLYPVKMGATTIWERWDGIRPDSTFQTPGMNSFNHYAYGAIGDWMYRSMVGLDTEEDGPGYRHIRVKPHIGEGFTHASASLKTYYGTVSGGWKKENDELQMTVEIPANTTAKIYIPAANAESVTESGKALSAIAGIKINGGEKGYVVIETGSGKYNFIVKK